ncbi:MAG: PKD domain-containing protein [Candidatus Marinimicrobia bacterium]|nr:PKD domain-containing protein [Candidatus Neomarinimicrobiota bacterium]
MKRQVFIILFLCFSHAEIIHESGELIEFFGGNAPGSDYDNWVSHVTEGIASSGYNDYGPGWLDVQTNGFGNYNRLNSGPELIIWETIFELFVLGDTLAVDSILQESWDIFFYEIVIFEDTTLNRTFHILREQLDSSFVDENLPTTPDDDVIGSFRNGWGLYIINPEAERDQVLIQVPHPCDDFIAPYIAMDLYLEIDAFGFMINGAGREVDWESDDDYTNSSSLSDPSRYLHTVFQKFQEAITEPLFNMEPHEPIVFAVHSFDNASHENRNSVILAAGATNIISNKPFRDISNDNFDIINFTVEFPIPAEQFTNTDPLHVIDYYEANYSGDFYYDNGTEQFLIRESTSLNGIYTGHQMVHLQSLVSGYSVYEPWVQIELDENPMLFEELDLSDELIYTQGLYPTSVHNFPIIRDYYKPFIQAVDSYITHWETIPDLIAPDSIKFLTASNQDANTWIRLDWQPEFDTNFKTYEIQYDTLDITENSPIINYTNSSILQNMNRTYFFIGDVDNSIPWYFRIRAKDYFGNVSPWSVTVSNILPGHSPPDTLVIFHLGTELNSIIDEDLDENSYGIDTSETMPGTSPTLVLFGNTWKSIEIEPILPDTQTIFKFFAKVDSVSEIQGIGFSNNEHTLRYSIAGTELVSIEDWIPVYQGSANVGVWKSYQIPIGDDWVAWFDTLSPITEIQFINDNDESETPGSIHFSLVLDQTPDLPIPPTVSIDFELGNVRCINQQEMVPVSFTSTIQDTDSYNFTYQWEFGDGNTATISNPSHDFLLEDDHDYTVILTVEDEFGEQGWATASIQVDEGESTFPLTMNFIGDIMMGRRFEESDGIITTQGVTTLFEPTYNILGNAADITIANLEIPLTNQGYAHPTKGIVFRCAPENIQGLLAGGIDVVSLANNHILDYMEPGIIQTQSILDEAGIFYSGAGLNSDEAYLPAILSRKGQTIAFLASSDRTGQYNNSQPFLNAGENKSGFAYMTPYYLKQQIHSVRDIVDLVVVEMHAGSEYSYSPGAHYDSYEPPDGFETMRFNPASEFGFIADPQFGMEAEDYSPRLDRPQMWDRAIRQFAIDEGADVVIVHHPHIIQGVEIYNGKMIAHSLGNFIFDLNYPETYPSMILNADADEFGFTDYSITPLYIDDYLTVPATGELGNYILNHIANQSRDLNTYVHVNQETQTAHVIMDTLSMESQQLDYLIWDPIWKETEFEGQPYFVSNPLPIPEAGSLSKILDGFENITHYRLGREKVWMNNFENEGSSLWDFNSGSEFIQNSIFRRGEAAATQIRNENSSENVITNLEERFPFKSELNHSLHGYIKTDNGKDVTLQIRLSQGRNDGTLLTTSMDELVQGTVDWRPYWGDVPSHEDANFFDIRMSTDVPDTGESQTWFDNVGLIEWDSLMTFDSFPISITHPNNFDYIQVYSTQTPVGPSTIQLMNTIIGDLPSLRAIPRAANPVITAPGKVHFYDESKGAVGNWHWVFLDQINVYQRHPSIHFTEPGVYEISLTVTGLDGETDSDYITVVALSNDAEEYNLGDINGDGILTAVDVLLCANYILGFMDFAPEEFVAADVNGSGSIDVFDLLHISDLLD